MIEQLIAYLQSIIAQYGAWGVFVATLIEEVATPIPSPLVPLAAGFFLIPTSATIIDAVWRAILIIGLPVAVGVSIGSSVVYAISFFGGKTIIDRWGRWLGVSWSEIEKAEQRFTRGAGDEITLFVLRMLPILPGVVISAFCGIVRYRFVSFILTTFFGSFVRSIALSLVGWQVGDLYATYADKLDKIEDYFLIGLAGVIVVLIALYYFRRSKAKRTNQS